MPAPSAPPTAVSPCPGDLGAVCGRHVDPAAVVAAGQHGRAGWRLAHVEHIGEWGAGRALHHCRRRGAAGHAEQDRPGLVGAGLARTVAGRSWRRCASCAKVSALDSSVGMPVDTAVARAAPCGPGGMAGRPLMPRTSAPPSPEMNRCGTRIDPVPAPAAALGQRGEHRRLADTVVGDADNDLLARRSARATSAAPSRIEVRCAGQQHLVLPGRGLALGGVDHHDRGEACAGRPRRRRPAACARTGSPRRRGRSAGCLGERDQRAGTAGRAARGPADARGARAGRARGRQ